MNVVLAVGGVVILGVILAASAPRGLTGGGLTGGGLARWASHQVPLFAAGAAAAGVVLAVLGLWSPAGIWIALAGVAAALVAYLVATPRGPGARQ